MIKKEGKFTYIEEGEGVPLILLHGLMGGVDNFGSMVDIVARAGYKVLAPDLQLFGECRFVSRLRGFFGLFKV